MDAADNNPCFWQSRKRGRQEPLRSGERRSWRVSRNRRKRSAEAVAPPRTFAEFGDRLRTVERQERGRLSAVATFALDQPLEIALGTVRSIAERCNAHAPIVVHLAQAVGFRGFAEMRAFVQRRFRS